MNDEPTTIDDTMLQRGLAEILADDTPPDLLARVRRATAAQRSAAALAMHRATPTPRRPQWFAAAVALLAITVVAQVFVLQRSQRTNAATQEPRSEELTPTDRAQFAKLLSSVQAVTLIARSDEHGARLPDLPEHAAVLADPALRQSLLAALATVDASAPSLPLAEAQGELVLHLDARRYLRGRLHFPAETGAIFGPASFASRADLPRTVAEPMRQLWRQLAAAGGAPRKKFQVSTTAELFAAIGSDRTIELSGGPFVLDPELLDGPAADDAVFGFADHYGTLSARLRGVHNLDLRAIGERVRVLGKTPSEVLGLIDCHDVWFEGLVLGHVDGFVGSCSAPVLTADDCSGLHLRDCDLFGCGTEGLIAKGTRDVTMERCVVHSCSAGVVQFHDCNRVTFAASAFRDCTLEWSEGGLIFDNCTGVAFRDCDVTRLTAGDAMPLFGIQMDEAIPFTGGSILGNHCARVATSKLLLVRDGTVERDNGLEVVVERQHAR